MHLVPLVVILLVMILGPGTCGKEPVALREINDPDLTDIAPTVLSILGLALPEGIDGRSMVAPTGALAKVTEGRTQGDGKGDLHDEGGQARLDPEEEEAIKRRLKALGYL